MDAKTKAKEIFDEMYSYQWRRDTKEFNNARKCALLLCEEMINTLIEIDAKKVMDHQRRIQFWNEVSQEINSY